MNNPTLEIFLLYQINMISSKNIYVKNIYLVMKHTLAESQSKPMTSRVDL